MKISTLDRKKFRVRNKLKKFSSKDRFRLCVSRSTKNISAQIIDDVNKTTLVSASSVEKNILGGVGKKFVKSVKFIGNNCDHCIYIFMGFKILTLLRSA